MENASKTVLEQNNSPKRERPLSPHLSIYRWHLSMVMSITNRVTGVALVFGTLLLGWLLIAVAWSPELYRQTTDLINTCPGYILLFGWSLALYYHMINGIRHLVWDTGHGFEIHTAHKTGLLVLFLTFLFTAATWYFAIYVR